MVVRRSVIPHLVHHRPWGVTKESIFRRSGFNPQFPGYIHSWSNDWPNVPSKQDQHHLNWHNFSSDNQS